MTRKEEIENYLQKIGKGEFDAFDFDIGFESGVEWADAHPHWISVEDELPIDYEPVLAVVGGNHFAFVGICLNKKTWYCETQNKAVEIIGITHWCHLPQPPHHFADVSKKVKKGGEG